MAINYTVSYTFSPSTTISSSQVNTNFSDNANTWTGLEALTKTFAKLKVDVDPATALEVATKQYVDHYSSYRRPVLQFVTVSTVTAETGINGTSGSVSILFPAGDLRTDSTSSHIVFDITRNCALSGTAQSGLRATLSETASTIYAIYAVKVTDSSSDFVLVGDTDHPIQANYASLNTHFGTGGWVFLGYICNGAGATQTTDICTFTQSGNLTILKNILATANVNGSGRDKHGLRMATTAGANTLTSSPTAGTTVGTNIPSTATQLIWTAVVATGTGQTYFGDSTVTNAAGAILGTIAAIGGVEESAWFMLPSSVGAGVSNAAGSSVAQSLIIRGWVDGALGVGSNPIL